MDAGCRVIDWGNQVGDGNTWRTLSREEWTYLLEGRTDAANKVGFATVCGHHGIIVLPDEFEDPKTNESESPNCEEKKFVPKSSTGTEQNVYSSGESWDKMHLPFYKEFVFSVFDAYARMNNLFIEGRIYLLEESFHWYNSTTSRTYCKKSGP